jgi:hypothetical protein
MAAGRLVQVPAEPAPQVIATVPVGTTPLPGEAQVVTVVSTVVWLPEVTVVGLADTVVIVLF